MLVAFFVTRAYRSFRETRRLELRALLCALTLVRENIKVYHSFQRVELTEELSPLVRLGFEGREDVSTDLSAVLLRMNLLSRERKMLLNSLRTLGEGNLKSETEKVENLIENVKNMLQKEEKEGKKSVDTLRIVLFTVVLSFIIILL